MESTAYYRNKLKNLQQAISSFCEIVAVDLSKKNAFECDVYKNAAVQKFEYTIELYWKVAKLFLFIYKGIDESSPKGVLKAFYQESQLSEENYESLLKMILHRNLLSHIYDSKQFEEIYAHLKNHAGVLAEAVKAFPSPS